MAIPSIYTENTLADYMLSVTAQIANVISFEHRDFEEAVNETLIAYGVDEIADATDIGKLRALARVEAWRAIVNSTSSEFDSSADSGETQVYYKRNQLHANAVKQLERAESEANRLGYVAADGTANTITFGAIVYSDPYTITKEDE
jgi:hypothetical protein